uniref:Uncharacterized protein n=1 Tax=Rhizophagus irregularis (strain DAOM 181602 / DAOM 197198 / MUCL 43194) TaxID=747089 RepID=U9T870_RHIID
MLQPLLEKPDALFFGINGHQMTFAASKYVKTYSKQSKQRLIFYYCHNGMLPKNRLVRLVVQAKSEHFEIEIKNLIMHKYPNAKEVVSIILQQKKNLLKSSEIILRIGLPNNVNLEDNLKITSEVNLLKMEDSFFDQNYKFQELWKWLIEPLVRAARRNRMDRRTYEYRTLSRREYNGILISPVGPIADSIIHSEPFLLRMISAKCPEHIECTK